MGIRGTDRQIDNIEFNVSDIASSKAFYGSVFGWVFTDYGPAYTEFSDGRATFAFPGGRRFHFIDPDGYELAVWTAQA